jgi:hypothetical protein
MLIDNKNKKMATSKTLTVKGKILEELIDNEDGKVKGWEDWTLEADHDSGEFNSEKGAMCDYKLTLYNDKTNDVYVGYGGYYTGITGHCFNYDVDFTLKRKKITSTKSKILTEKQIKAILLKTIKKSDHKTVKKVLNQLK